MAPGGPQEEQAMTRSLEFSILSLLPPGRGDWVNNNQSYIHDEASKKTPNIQGLGDSGWMDRSLRQESGTPQLQGTEPPLLETF